METYHRVRECIKKIKSTDDLLEIIETAQECNNYIVENNEGNNKILQYCNYIYNDCKSIQIYGKNKDVSSESKCRFLRYKLSMIEYYKVIKSSSAMDYIYNMNELPDRSVEYDHHILMRAIQYSKDNKIITKFRTIVPNNEDMCTIIMKMDSRKVKYFMDETMDIILENPALFILSLLKRLRNNEFDYHRFCLILSNLSSRINKIDYSTEFTNIIPEFLKKTDPECYYVTKYKKTKYQIVQHLIKLGAKSNKRINFSLFFDYVFHL